MNIFENGENNERLDIYMLSCRRILDLDIGPIAEYGGRSISPFYSGDISPWRMAGGAHTRVASNTRILNARLFFSSRPSTAIH